MKCPECQSELVADADFCHRCGTPLRDEPTARRAKSEHRATVKSSTAGRLRPQRLTDLDEVDDREYVLWIGTYSAKGMIHYWLMAIAVTIAAPVFATLAGIDDRTSTAVFLAVAAGWLLLFLYLGYKKLEVRYELTNQRLMHNRGILIRHGRRIEVIDIDDVSLRQSIIERLLDVGTIVIHSSDRSDPVLALPAIDRVREVAQRMDDARRAERVRRGLHIESV